MLQYFKRILFFCTFLIVAQICVAQKDSAAKTNDSMNAVLLNDYSKKLNEIEQQRVDDSIKRADLESQINALKTTNNLQKETLQKDLQNLAEKDARRLAEKKQRIDSLRLTAKSFPVEQSFGAREGVQIKRSKSGMSNHDRFFSENTQPLATAKIGPKKRQPADTLRLNF